METIKAGRELDQAVAERLFGARDFRKCSFGVYMSVPGEEDRRELPRYSTSIEAAWQVVEKLRERFEEIGIHWSARYAEWIVELYYIDGESEVGHVTAPTAPLAIALAALKAVGEGVGA